MVYITTPQTETFLSFSRNREKASDTSDGDDMDDDAVTSVEKWVGHTRKHKGTALAPRPRGRGTAEAVIRGRQRERGERFQFRNMDLFHSIHQTFFLELST